MKKIIAHIVLWAIILAVLTLFVYRIIIEPCVYLYSIFGLLGIGVWIVVIAIIGIIFWGIIALMNWVIDNI